VDHSEVKDLDSMIQWMKENNFSPQHFEPQIRSKPVARPYLWKWADVETCLSLVTKYVGMEDTTRRTFPLVNPRNDPGVQRPLGMGVQCILPGEQEISHRHTAAALRFVIKGTADAYNLGDGEPMLFDEGSLITNPSLTFHGHANNGDEPVVWVDTLDHRYADLVTGFGETYPGQEPVDLERVEFTNKTRGLVQPSWIKPRDQHPPPFRYPWSETKAALDALKVSEAEPNPHDGYHLTFRHPVTGGSTLPTIAAEIQLLPPHFQGKAHRHTSTVSYHAFRGQGVTIVAGERLEWSKGDFFFLPAWAEHEHHNPSDEDAILYSVTDWPVMKSMGHYYTEESLAAKGVPAERARGQM